MSSWPATRRRRTGRHTSLIDAARDELAPADPVDRVFGAWPPPRGGDLNGGGPRVYIRGEEPGGRVWAGPDAGGDTIVLPGLGLFRDPPPAPGIPGRGTGLNRPAPPRPWWHRRWRLALISAGLAVLAMAGFLGIPPLLSALGLGSQAACPLCQFPIPSSAPIGAGTGPSPAPSTPAPRPSAPSRAASASATAPPPPVRVVAPPPPASTPPPTLEVSYTAVPAGDGFTGQVTVVNRGSSPVSGWRLVVALPGDTVSAVQNAEFSDDADVLFMTPAPDDLSVAPGGSVTVSIYASGPDPTPAECSFNDVACQ